MYYDNVGRVGDYGGRLDCFYCIVSDISVYYIVGGAGDYGGRLASFYFIVSGISVHCSGYIHNLITQVDIVTMM